MSSVSLPERSLLQLILSVVVQNFMTLYIGGLPEFVVENGQTKHVVELTKWPLLLCLGQGA